MLENNIPCVKNLTEVKTEAKEGYYKSTGQILETVKNYKKQGRKGFRSTSMSRKAIRDTSSAPKWSPIASTKIAYCHLSSVNRQILITLDQNL